MRINLKKAGVYASFLVFTILFSCLDKPNNSEPAQDYPLPIPIENSTSNDSLAFALGQTIQGFILERDSVGFVNAMNLEAFGNRVTYMEYKNPLLKRYIAQFKMGLKQGMSALPMELITLVNQGAYYDFIGYYYDEEVNTYRLIFRFFSDESGINYHDYELSPGKAGDLQVSDIFIYANGQEYSQTLNWIFLSSLPKNIIEKVIFSTAKSDADQLTATFTESRRGNHELALDYLHGVSDEMKKEKNYHLFNIRLSQQLGDDKYIAALGEMLNQFKDDPSCALLFMDYYIHHGNFEAAYQIIEDLEEATTDGFLNYLKGNLAAQEGNLEKAVESYEAMQMEFPDFHNASIDLIVVRAMQGNYQECNRLLNRLIGHGLEKEALHDMLIEMGYEQENRIYGYLDSKEYAQWLN
ncbi:tetratricopeptide repeat protein [Sediminicola luteus]|uniref:Tetratricopeptide repeat protein n=1 Tax=Sediminicola luteus TaxID=319238 RepID=A0A2A4G154_9FLAO|nr:hypothetical protein [Sediminicola luteus]PCE62427.1 hypothetical protein B7P33_18920 [Sediminicola luteus]